MNNYDQSSSGVNLALTCFYDTDLSYLDFKENFEADEWIKNPYGKDPIWHYIDWGNIAPLDLTDSASYDFTKGDLLALYDSITDYNIKRDCSEYNGKPFSKCTKAELWDYLQDSIDRGSLFPLLVEYLNPRFELVEVRGYCQGDYAQIVVSDKFWEIVGAEKPDNVQAYFSKTFIDLLYRAPLRAELMIDDIHYYFDDYMQDRYHYDKDELLEIAEKHITHDKKAYILEWLADNLPEYPDYR